MGSLPNSAPHAAGCQCLLVSRSPLACTPPAPPPPPPGRLHVAAGSRVLVVTHGGCLQAVHRHVRGCLYPGKLVNGCVCSVRIQGAAWAVAAWNEGRHLAAAGCCQADDGGGSAGFGGGTGEA